MARTVAEANGTHDEHDARAAEPAHESLARGDRLSGLQEATHRHEPSAERISGFDHAASVPAGAPASFVPETEDGREAPLSSVEIEISPSGSAVAGEPDPCADIPIMRELGLQRGTMIADTYRIVRPLGSGGMGVVTLAHDDRLDRDVAIKFVRPELFNQNLRDLFSVEARAMARVSHPNVLTVHTFGDHDGTPYFVMEYVEGPTVEQWLEQRRGAPDIEEALRILDQTCLGVEAIHAASTVHRDLKPSNLLIDATLRVAVSDLGVARILEGASGADATCIVGSAAYMAPEAALGDDSKPELATRRDIYALGCIAYELLTGRPPFVAPTDMGLMAKHLLEMPPLASSLRADLTGYDDVLLRALDKDPHKRWRSVGAFRRALERVRAGEEIPARILIADDDEDWRTLLHDALQPRFPDAVIDLVSDGEQAIAAFEKNPYSVVLVDLQMPEVDGMRLTAHLRSLDASDQTPIIVMTAAGGPGEWKRLSQIGADAFLVKPVAFEDVAMQITRTMKSRHRKS
ncbi:MAG: Serine/threonine-protein kinase PknB [Myxococcaceae bacterium]|nr:Serine/threonine-protein kinase PknB [Myxococcaceae bacterium]